MIPALLFAALVAVGSTGSGAPVAESVVTPAVRPPITVGVTHPGCGVVTFTVYAPTPTPVAGWHDIIGAEPTRATVGGSVLKRVKADPGTIIRWGVTYFYPDDTGVAAEGRVTVPPCLAPALVPVDIGTPYRIEANPRRARVLDKWTRLIVRGRA